MESIADIGDEGNLLPYLGCIPNLKNSGVHFGNGVC